MQITVKRCEFEFLKTMDELIFGKSHFTFIKNVSDKKDERYGVIPYLVEESYENIEEVFKKIYEIGASGWLAGDYPIRWDEYEQYFLVIEDIYLIYKAGRRIGKLEYVYEKIKDETPYELQYFDEERGFVRKLQVIFLRLNELIEIYLYLYYDDFVLDVICEKYKQATHWHPFSCEQAIEDLKKIYSGETAIVFKKPKNDKPDPFGIDTFSPVKRKKLLKKLANKDNIIIRGKEIFNDD